MAGKGTRITVDLGDAELAKAVKIAAVESGRTVRDIVVEALHLWLERDRQPQPPAKAPPGEKPPVSGGSSRDYHTMIETLNKYRGTGSR
jgi:hypothetical protein